MSATGLKFQTTRSLEDQLVRVKQVNQALRSRIQHGRVQTSVARVLYDDFMDAFPSSVPGRPDFANLKAVGKADMHIYSYLGADPFCKGYRSHVLHLPRRTVWTSGTRLHALAFGPTHAYRPSAETWRESSEISALGGTSRELFVEQDDALFYVGTYRCHDLRYLCPGGTRAPNAVSAFEIINAAQLGDLPVPESVSAIKKFFSDGVIPADCLGLECVGFNSTLYNALCARVAEFQRGSKRGADEMAPEEYGRRAPEAYGRRANRLEDDLPTWTIKKEDC
ncbi:hypothetical protein C8R43DRAFT_502974 [Mycena crocata]|nr:hypothetical protein C8R43DRAFT_502974 [Mycena crocata]